MPRGGAARSAGELFHNLLEAGFNGPVYPVNPKAEVVQSVLAYPSVLEVPGPVDLAVMVVPAPAVVQAARECAAKGVRAIVVISAGFAETGPEGAQRQRELLAVCRATGMRLIGPNCLGVVNTDPEVRLDATFGPIVPLPGPGRLPVPERRPGAGHHRLRQRARAGAVVVRLGRQQGRHLQQRPARATGSRTTGPRWCCCTWSRSATRASSPASPAGWPGPSRSLAVKSGRSAAGARATSSHTGALLAASDVTVDALFHQAGVIRTDTLAELFDVASLLANQPIPAGRRVGIVTNAGGPGILCADACEAGGLEVVRALRRSSRPALAEGLPAEAAVANPVDMLASAPPEHYRRTVELVADLRARSTPSSPSSSRPCPPTRRRWLGRSARRRPWPGRSRC